MIFDYSAAARRAGIPQPKLDHLVALLRAEFPDDETMAELHILPAVLAVGRGETTPEEILSQEVSPRSAKGSSSLLEGESTHRCRRLTGCAS